MKQTTNKNKETSIPAHHPFPLKKKLSKNFFLFFVSDSLLFKFYLLLPQPWLVHPTKVSMWQKTGTLSAHAQLLILEYLQGNFWVTAATCFWRLVVLETTFWLSPCRRWVARIMVPSFGAWCCQTGQNLRNRKWSPICLSAWPVSCSWIICYFLLRYVVFFTIFSLQFNVVLRGRRIGKFSWASWQSLHSLRHRDQCREDQAGDKQHQWHQHRDQSEWTEAWNSHKLQVLGISYNWWGFEAWDTLKDSTDNSSIDKAETSLESQKYFSQLQDTTDAFPYHIYLPVC